MDLLGDLKAPENSTPEIMIIIEKFMSLCIEFDIEEHILKFLINNVVLPIC